MDKKHIVLLVLIVLLSYFTMSSKTKYEKHIELLSHSLSVEQNEVIRLKSNLNLNESKILDLEVKIKKLNSDVRRDYVEYYENGKIKRSSKFSKKESSEDKSLSNKDIELKDLALSNESDSNKKLNIKEDKIIKKEKTFFEKMRNNWAFVLIVGGLIYYGVEQSK